MLIFLFYLAMICGFLFPAQLFNALRHPEKNASVKGYAFRAALTFSLLVILLIVLFKYS